MKKDNQDVFAIYGQEVRIPLSIDQFRRLPLNPAYNQEFLDGEMTSPSGVTAITACSRSSSRPPGWSMTRTSPRSVSSPKAIGTRCRESWPRRSAPGPRSGYSRRMPRGSPRPRPWSRRRDATASAA